MKHDHSYFRKISAEEAKKGFVFVLKDSLSYFPSPGKPFTIISDKGEKPVSVESYRCTCRGPDLPHEHYFIKWAGVRFAEKVSIVKETDAIDKYRITIRR